MLGSFPVAVVTGILLGFLAGLGVGGGSLLMLWLTIVLGEPHSLARGINLLFFIPTALISCFFRAKQGSLPFGKVLPAILCGTVSAGLFSMLSIQFDIHLLTRLFGILLLITGIRELLYRPRKAR